MSPLDILCSLFFSPVFQVQSTVKKKNEFNVSSYSVIWGSSATTKRYNSRQEHVQCCTSCCPRDNICVQPASRVLSQAKLLGHHHEQASTVSESIINGCRDYQLNGEKNSTTINTKHSCMWRHLSRALWVQKQLLFCKKFSGCSKKEKSTQVNIKSTNTGTENITPNSMHVWAILVLKSKGGGEKWRETKGKGKGRFQVAVRCCFLINKMTGK